tara:strand:+ start:126 stop:344 length:219 start_codon:yes stop_codon:yes gene_type:complete
MIAEIEGLFVAKLAEGVPSIVGYYDQRGKLRRIVAQYPDGWRSQVNIDREGYVTSAHSSLKLKGIVEKASNA